MARLILLGLAACCCAAMCLPQVDHDYSASSRPPNPVPPDRRVDINHAALGDLLAIPGMTRSWASRILRFKPYRTKDDLLDKGVLPAHVYNRVRDYLIAHREAQ